MRLEIPDDFDLDPRFAAMRPESRGGAEDADVSAVISLLCETARKYPDGFRPDLESAGGLYKHMADVGWLDRNPMRVRDWLSYAGSALRNRCRTEKAREWYAETIRKWSALGFEPKAPSSSGGVGRRGHLPDDKADERADIPSVALPDVPIKPAKKQKKQPEQLRLDGETDKPAGKKLSGQQQVIERFAQVKKLDWSTPEARSVICKANAAAAASIIRMASGDEKMALAFVEIATEAKDEQMKEWTKRDGQDHGFAKLAGILDMWSEFKAAWDKMPKKTEARSEHRQEATAEARTGHIAGPEESF